MSTPQTFSDQMQVIIDALEAAQSGMVELAKENERLRETLQYWLDEVIDNEDGHDNLLRAADLTEKALKGQPMNREQILARAALYQQYRDTKEVTLKGEAIVEFARDLLALPKEPTFTPISYEFRIPEGEAAMFTSDTKDSGQWWFTGNNVKISY